MAAHQGGMHLRTILKAMVSSHFGGMPGTGAAASRAPPALAWAGAHTAEEGEGAAAKEGGARGLAGQLSELLGGIWNMAVPKKRVRCPFLQSRPPREERGTHTLHAVCSPPTGVHGPLPSPCGSPNKGPPPSPPASDTLRFRPILDLQSSISRNRKRWAAKKLQWDESIEACMKCGLPRRPHTYCEQFNCGKSDKDRGEKGAIPSAKTQIEIETKGKTVSESSAKE